MEKFLLDVLSIYWWASVVIVGLLINLASAYIKAPLDRRIGSASHWWRRRSERRDAALLDMARGLSEHPEEFSYWTARETQYYLVSTFWLTFALIGALAMAAVVERNTAVSAAVLVAILLAVLVKAFVALKRGHDANLVVTSAMSIRRKPLRDSPQGAPKDPP